MGGPSLRSGGLTIEILEVRQLNPLPHSQHERRRAQTIDTHPHIPRMQRLQLITCDRTIPIATKSMLNIGPSRDHTRQNHQPKREQSHPGDRAAKPKDLTVCDEDDGHVFEDGVDWNGEVLDRFGTGVDHRD